MNTPGESILSIVEDITAAEALLICAGAVLEADPGRPDFYTAEGFQKTYPAAAALGLTITDWEDPSWFDRDPARAWGVYGQRIELLRRPASYPGLTLLHRWAEQMLQGCFVFTTHIDGLFQQAGFADDGMVESQGSLHHLQCTKPCCAATWPLPNGLRFDTDEASLRARGELPRCTICGGQTRPNILLPGDNAWNPGRTAAQQIRFRLWLRKLARSKLAVIELGADQSIHQTAEQFANAAGVPLIRVDLRMLDAEFEPEAHPRA